MLLFAIALYFAADLAHFNPPHPPPPPPPPPCCSEEETELEKAASEWGRKHRPKKTAAAGKGRGTEFKLKDNVRKGTGRKR